TYCFDAEKEALAEGSRCEGPCEWIASPHCRTQGTGAHQQGSGPDVVRVSVRYLLDVNALVALGLFQHEFHVRVTSWVTKITADDSAELATCAITELGFVRILAQATQYGFAISHARSLLFSLKKAGIARFTFITDDQDVSRLPAWVKTPRRT